MTGQCTTTVLCDVAYILLFLDLYNEEVLFSITLSEFHCQTVNHA